MDTEDWKNNLPLDYMEKENFSLQLARSVIKFEHGTDWQVDKTNNVYDLICCLEGHAEYEIGYERFDMAPGDMVLIEPNVPFKGHISKGEHFVGIAQHFQFWIFGVIDFFAYIQYQRKISLKDWASFKPILEYYWSYAPVDSIIYGQNCAFHVILTKFIRESFINTRFQKETPYFILETAAHVGARAQFADTLDSILEEIPYSRRYLDNEFKRFTGKTLKQFWLERKLKKAEKLLTSGNSVKETAYLLGFTDPLYFSRLFKNKRGYSPSEVR
ncbi:AraC family transcriptional regulator [Spirochaeta cellobiosiphila]|uniref:AraC family transcriptional regulator n=1 Tax=Spirochaeta cellobiosiphila TaxID=504483 RepID=UPI0003F8A95B|nr:AraC family transcriptional regulator [Spirochaeta cellobiosiphila]